VTHNPETTPISTFCVAFHIFEWANTDFKFGVQVDHSKSQPTDNKLSLPIKINLIKYHSNDKSRIHPEMVGDMSRVTLNFHLSKIPFCAFLARV